MKINPVVSQYLGAVVVIGVGCAVAAVTTYFVNPNLSISQSTVTLFRIISACLFAASTLGRCGWSIQTWDGNSKNEQLNLKIFKTSYVLGFMLLIMSLVLNPTENL